MTQLSGSAEQLVTDQKSARRDGSMQRWLDGAATTGRQGHVPPYRHEQIPGAEQ